MARAVSRDQALPLTSIAMINLHESGVSWPRVPRRATDACTAIAALAMTFHTTGIWPESARQYAQLVGISERKAQREWEAFHEAFPTEESPLRLAQHLYAQVGAQRIADRGALLRVPGPADLQPV